MIQSNFGFCSYHFITVFMCTFFDGSNLFRIQLILSFFFLDNISRSGLRSRPSYSTKSRRTEPWCNKSYLLNDPAVLYRQLLLATLFPGFWIQQALSRERMPGRVWRHFGFRENSRGNFRAAWLHLKVAKF